MYQTLHQTFIFMVKHTKIAPIKPIQTLGSGQKLNLGSVGIPLTQLSFVLPHSDLSRLCVSGILQKKNFEVTKCFPSCTVYLLRQT